MDTIASFEVNHLTLKPGIYLSRVDSGIRTYDVRVTFPNREFLPTAVMHTIEHLFAVHVRNGVQGNHVIYFGPMGCRTGFYLLLAGLSDEAAVEMIRDAFSYIAAYEGPIPGATERECGNYREHDLVGAKQTAARYSDVIRNWTVEQLKY